MLEVRLENFLAQNPHLINPIFSPNQILRQVAIKGNICDLQVTHDQGVTLIELKVVSLTVSEVGQILRYCDVWRRHKKRVAGQTHYLIGPSIENPGEISQLLLDSEYFVEVKTYGPQKDIPIDYNRQTGVFELIN